MHLDHFVLGVSNLDYGMATFARLTGVQPVFGGDHTELGTHNALAGLDGDRYVEILAPRPDAQLPAMVRAVAGYRELAPFLWCLATSDMTGTERRLRTAGFHPRPPTRGGRITPTGVTLGWTICLLDEPDLVNAPFFITWDDSTVHPARTAPAGCRLETFAIADPNADRLRRLMDVIEYEVNLTPGEPDQTSIVLGSPNGRVVLGARSRAA